MRFSLKDFNALNSQIPGIFPKNFFPFIPLDKKKYNELERQHNESGINIVDAFHKLQKRTGEKYFNKVYPAQTSALNFSERSFPAYRFLLPEVLTDDWLGIVDPHNKHHRDHALHQPLTAYIVFKLLGGGISKKSLKINGRYLLDLCIDQIFRSKKTNYIKDYLIDLGVNTKGNNNVDLLSENNFSREFWKSLFFETALVSAIFYDIGYPWQYISKLNKSLRSSNFTPNGISADADFVYKKFMNRLILYPFNGYKHLTNNSPSNWNEKLLDLISASISKTHGFPGALGFLYLNDITREFPTSKDSPFSQFCVEWAALGIMMHDLMKIYNGDKITKPENAQMRLEFDKDPLSCIITLADVLEEFERPKVDFKVQYEGSRFIYKHACLESEIKYDEGKLYIVYKYNDMNGVANKLPYIVNDEYDYFDSEFGYLDFSSIGINQVRLDATV